MQTIPVLHPKSSPPQRFRGPLLLTLAAGLVAAVISIFLPNYYKSEVRILSDAGNAGGPNLRAGVWAPSAVPETVSNREDGPTIIFADILKSRRMAETLLQASYTYPLKAGRFGETHQVHGTLLNYLGADNVDRGIAGLKSVLVVQRDMKSGLLTLTVETRSPELSMQVVQLAAKSLKDFLVELSQAAGKTKAEFTQGRLTVVNEKFESLGREFLNFEEVNRNWQESPSPSVRYRGDRLKDDLELWKQVKGNLTLNHEQALLEARNDTQNVLILDPGNLPHDKSRPSRALVVFLTMFLTGLASWTYTNRSIVYHRFLAKEPAA
jgi:uncharacterized protein involved in exopolysaccharide biosynthesis